MTAVAAKPPERLKQLPGVTSNDKYSIDPRIIQIEEGLNPRDINSPETRAHIDWLKESIRLHGTETPIKVRYDNGGKRCILVDGWCRLTANLELIAEGVEIEKIDAIQVSANDPALRLVTSMLANTGQRLTTLENGRAYLRLRKFGWSDEKIADTFSAKVRYVREAIELAETPETIQQMVSYGVDGVKASESLAITAVREHGDQATAIVTEAVVSAKAAGKKTATRAAAQNGSVAQKRYTHNDAKALILALQEIATRSGDKESRNVAKAALENVGAL